MNNEFLRRRENSCKWCDELGVMRRILFIEKGDKNEFSHQNNIVNRFTKWMNRFRQQKTTQKCMKDETIKYMCESIQVNPGWRLIRFNLLLNRFSLSQRVLVRRFKLKRVDSSVNRFRKMRIDSTEVRNFDESIQWIMNRFRRHKMTYEDTFPQGHNWILTQDT